MKAYWFLALPLLTLLMVGCGPSRSTVGELPAAPAAGSESQLPSPTQDEKAVESISSPGASDMTPLPADKEKLISLAKQDLADRLKIDPALIALVKTMDITWPNISAGCNSSPGQILSKGRTYGYRVWLEASGVAYVYHVGESGQVIPCAEPAPGASNPLLVTPGGPTPPPGNGQP